MANDCHNYTQIFPLDENMIFHIMTKQLKYLLSVIAQLASSANQHKPSVANFFSARDGHDPNCRGYL